MVPPVATQPSLPAAPRSLRLLGVAAGLAGAALVAGTLALWFHYGTRVFFEAIASGIASCF